MAELEAKSALYPEYRIGVYGAPAEKPLIVGEKRGRVMVNLIVWDEQAVNDHLQKIFQISLPETGGSTSNEKIRVLWIGPGRYLMVARDQSIIASMAHLEDDQGAIQDLSSARTIITVKGEALRQVLAKGLTVKLDEPCFAPGQVILSSFNHHYPGIVHNISGDQPAVDIYITRSFTLSFWQWLCDSCLEFGYEVIDAVG